ncbi:MAG: WbuC family cupin fold metalloprotein [Tannerellaceae bacterium]|nr:WbuC family cupin fold metalloprotein [Tannerellaceae bacterium]
MKIVNEALLNELTEQAKTSPRLRMNYNFHEEMDAPIHRLLNAIEPDSYVRPHRHQHPDKEEIFLVLRGKAVFFLFDEEGNITGQLLLDPLNGCYGAEIKPGIWHTLLILEKGTVIYEVKEGPFAPLSPENFAPWSPAPEQTEEARNYMEYLAGQVNTQS